jgi:hypothetical protein
MRNLSENEKNLITRFSEKLDGTQRKQLLSDLDTAVVKLDAEDGSRVMFDIANYHRPAYAGQHLFNAEGRILDRNGAELSVLLYADENGHLLELEFIRWDSSRILGPRWSSLKVF